MTDIEAAKDGLRNLRKFAEQIHREAVALDTSASLGQLIDRAQACERRMLSECCPDDEYNQRCNEWRDARDAVTRHLTDRCGLSFSQIKALGEFIL